MKKTTKYKIVSYSFTEIESSKLQIRKKTNFKVFRKRWIFWKEITNPELTALGNKYDYYLSFNTLEEAENYIYLYHKNKPGKVEIKVERIIELKDE